MYENGNNKVKMIEDGIRKRKMNWESKRYINWTMLNMARSEPTKTTNMQLTRQITFLWLKLFEAKTIASTEHNKLINAIILTDKNPGKDSRKTSPRALLDSIPLPRKCIKPT